MTASKIEWTDVVWNPVRGCSRVSEGCRHCYAERQAARFSDPGQPFFGFAERVAKCPECHGEGLLRGPRFGECARCGGSLEKGRGTGQVSVPPRWTGKVEIVPDALEKPLRWRKPRRVFVNSMSDLFHEALPDEAIDLVFAVMASARRHTFQVLTKRPERMRRWVKERLAKPTVNTEEDRDAYRPPLANVWLGVSVEDQASADARIPLLLDTPAALRWVSYEPALGPVDFTRVMPRGEDGARLCGLSGAAYSDADADELVESGAALDWLVVGGESGPGARPCDVAWLRGALKQCKAAGVPCFVKQMGAGVSLHTEHGRGRHVRDRERDQAWVLRHPKGGEPSEWPEDLRVREFPAEVR